LSRSLKVVQQNRPVATPLLPPIFCAALADTVYLAGLDSTQENTMLLHLDRVGNVQSSTVVAHFSLSGMAICNEMLLLTGAAQPAEAESSEAHARLAALDHRGQLLWQREIHVGDLLQSWPVPLCAGNHPRIVWTTEDATSSLHLQEIGINPEPPLVIPLEGSTYGLRLPPLQAANAIIVGRLCGNPLHFDLLHMGDGGLIRQQTILPALDSMLPDLVILGQRIAVLWAAPGGHALYLQWFGEDFSPLGAPQPVAVAPAPDAFRSAHLFAGAEGQIALTYLIWRRAEPDEVLGTFLEDGSEVVTQWVALLDKTNDSREALPVSMPVQFPGTTFNAGTWVTDRLFLIHGGEQAFLSIYAGDSASR
jgi:hypothetical protein